jgi:hypothetical protein
MNIMDYVKPELLILIPTCWGIGMVLKATSLNNQAIPGILCLCSVALAGLYVAAQSGGNLPMAIFTGITQGVIAWLVAWVTYEKGIKMIGVATEAQGGDDDAGD